MARFNSFSRFIQGKLGNFKSFSSIFSNALSLNITSCDNAISVIIVVFFLPIVPQTIKTIGREFMNPRFFISQCLSLAYPIFLRHHSIKRNANNPHAHSGKNVNTDHRSIKSLYNCMYRFFISKDIMKYR